MRINLQSKYLEKTICKFNHDLQKCISDITKEVFKASLINDKVNDLEAKLQELSTEKNTLANVNLQLKDKMLCSEYSQRKFNLIFYGIRETNATFEEEINNLFDTMFGE